MSKFKAIIITLIFILTGAMAGWFSATKTATPVSRNFVVKARQYAYDPPKIEVNVGDTLHFKLIALDVVHGFYLENYDLDAEIWPNQKTFKIRKPSQGHNWVDTTGFTVIADKTGKFRYRCSHTCGNMHPFMMGELIVHPNYLLFISIGMLTGLVLGLILVQYLKLKGSLRKGKDSEKS